MTCVVLMGSPNAVAKSVATAVPNWAAKARERLSWVIFLPTCVLREGIQRPDITTTRVPYWHKQIVYTHVHMSAPQQQGQT
jgi:hypothetical protein